MIGFNTESQQDEQQTINNNYPTGDIDNYLDEFNQSKEDMGTAPDFDDFTDLEETEEQNQKLDTRATRAAARASGRLLTSVIDSTLPMTLGIIAKEDPLMFKASEEDHEDLEEAFTEYMALKGGDIPPGVLVIILVASIYGTKLPQAISLRKINARKEELDKREAALIQREKMLNKKTADDGDTDKND